MKRKCIILTCALFASLNSHAADYTLCKTIKSGPSINSLAYHPHQDIIATGLGNGNIVLHHGDTKTVFKAHTQRTSALAFSPDGRHLVSGSYDKTASIWNVDNHKRQCTLADRFFNIFSVVYKDDGTEVAIACRNNKIKIYDVVTQAKKKTLVFNGGMLTNRLVSCAYSADGQQLAIASSRGEILFYDTSSYLVSGQFRVLENIASLALHPNRTHFAVGFYRGILHTYTSIFSRQPLASIQYKEGINKITYSPNGRYIATGTRGNKLEICDSTNLDKINSADFPSPVHSLAFNHNGTKIAAASYQIAQVYEDKNTLPRMLALASVLHSRLGAESPARTLSQYLVQNICSRLY